MNGLIPLDDFENAIASLSVANRKHAGDRNTAAKLYPGNAPKTSHAPQIQPSAKQTPRGDCIFPLEIIDQIAAILTNDSQPSSGPSWLHALESATLQDSRPAAALTPAMNAAFRTLLALSATCKAYRMLLAPAVWRNAYFQHPRHFGELINIMSSYRALASPLHRSQASANWQFNEGFPLRFVRQLNVCMPRRFPGFAQELLVQLLRNGMNQNLEHVVWEAEELPAGSTLRALVPALDWMSATKIGDEQSMQGLGSEVNADEIVRWTRESADGEAFPSGSALDQERSDSKDFSQPQQHSLARNGICSLSINCKCFWPGHAALQQLTALRYLRLTDYDLFLMPPHLPALLQKLQRPLLALSLSTSMTSVMHSLPLIHAGCFDQLEVLDLFPVTPESPLPQAIRRSRKSLRVLRLTVDISANFANYDAFWRILTGDAAGRDSISQEPMEALEILHVDPLPQQNTAPSFEGFLQRGSPRLAFINGKLKTSFGPGVHDIDPDHITSALVY